MLKKLKAIWELIVAQCNEYKDFRAICIMCAFCVYMLVFFFLMLTSRIRILADLWLMAPVVVYCAIPVWKWQMKRKKEKEK